MTATAFRFIFVKYPWTPSTTMSMPLKFGYTETPSNPTREDAKTVSVFIKYRY